MLLKHPTVSSCWPNTQHQKDEILQNALKWGGGGDASSVILMLKLDSTISKTEKNKPERFSRLFPDTGL